MKAMKEIIGEIWNDRLIRNLIYLSISASFVFAVLFYIEFMLGR